MVFIILYFLRQRKKNYFIDEENEKFKKYINSIPKEALLCPNMRGKILLNNKEFMKKNWKKVLYVVENNIMPQQ